MWAPMCLRFGGRGRIMLSECSGRETSGGPSQLYERTLSRTADAGRASGWGTGGGWARTPLRAKSVKRQTSG